MRTEVFQFEGKEISFLTPVVAQRKDVATNVMVNATEMAKIFGKQVGHFLENENTQVFIKECLINNRISDYLNISLTVAEANGMKSLFE
jgi:hypothetical protein